MIDIGLPQRWQETQPSRRSRAQAVDAFVLPGSDYPAALAIGAEVQLELEDGTNNVLVTRGGGFVKLACLVGPGMAGVRRCLRHGNLCSGRIGDVLRHPRGKLLRIDVDGRP